jgi:hypothetical protein
MKGCAVEVPELPYLEVEFYLARAFAFPIVRQGNLFICKCEKTEF